MLFYELHYDSDGIQDDFEVQFGLDYTNAEDASEDGDGDGLDNEAEYIIGTDISLSDTDGDGVSDGEEAAGGTDPLDSESYDDTDIETVPAVYDFLLWGCTGGLILLGLKQKNNLPLIRI